MRHPFVGDVNDLFDEINRAINLRLQSEQYRRFSNPSRARYHSDILRVVPVSRTSGTYPDMGSHVQEAH